MLYRNFDGDKLSMLGMGLMRLPTIDGKDNKIDETAAQKLVDTAIKEGINYFDTAWGYHSGNSELFIGKALEKHPRDSFYLASKFPGYDVSSFGHAEEIFEKQLEKCRVDYFDYYLFHNVCEMNIEQYLDDDRYGTAAYLKEQKKKGRIRHLGFSAHGNINTIKRFLDAYGNDVEFCQLQLNYLDWSFQNAMEKAELIKRHNLALWVMEPVRGGKLARLSDRNTARLKALRPDESIPAWAFRFLQTLPEVTVILSGMSNGVQLADNLRTFEEEKPLSSAEMKELLDIADAMTKKSSVPCTACRYCTTHCPQSLDIPYLIELYNEHCFTEDFAFIAPMALTALTEEKRPSACVGCRSCEAVCPQQIKVSDVMQDFCARLITE